MASLHPAARQFAVAALLAASGVVAACDSPAPGPGAPPVTALATAPSPAAPGSGEPNLTMDADGVVHLSWLEPSETGHALRFARLEESRWSEPRTIIDRPDLFVNWADFPSLAVFGDGVMAAHWLEKSGPGLYSYDVRVALSSDGGETWSDDIVPHRDGVEAEHGFVSLLALGHELGALWLDGRATVDGDPMTLRFTTIDGTGALGPEVRVDGSVCDCCQTAMARTADGLVAAYRDRTAGEVRDIYVARTVDGQWTEGVAVHDDGWVIDACPVNGPALATRGDTVIVAWFTAAATGDAPGQQTAGAGGRVLAAFSYDGGATFGGPVRVDEGGGMGRVDALAMDGGAALISWLERTEEGAEIRVRRVESTGVGPAMSVAGTAAERATGFPRMIRSGDRVVFAWTQAGEGGGVRTALATVAEDPTRE